MCIIAIKPAGVPVPELSTLRNMWDSNSDGAGFMYALNGQVHIHKGFMKFDSFLYRLNALEKTIDFSKIPAIFHFRIMTSGKPEPAQTHPFPVTNKLSKLRKLRTVCNLAMAHNGIIRNKPTRPDMSDTMEYVLKRLHPLRKAEPSFLTDKRLLDLIRDQTQSKLAFLTGSGEIVTVGMFETALDGLTYSNDSYLDIEAWYANYNVWDWRSGKTRKGKASYQHLTWLNSDSEYLVDDAGEFYEADDYLVDEEGNIYKYDFTNAADGDYAIPVTGLYVVPTESRITRYEEEWATIFDTEE